MRPIFKTFSLNHVLHWTCLIQYLCFFRTQIKEIFPTLIFFLFWDKFSYHLCQDKCLFTKTSIYLTINLNKVFYHWCTFSPQDKKKKECSYRCKKKKLDFFIFNCRHLNLGPILIKIFLEGNMFHRCIAKSRNISVMYSFFQTRIFLSFFVFLPSNNILQQVFSLTLQNQI